jgi:hypothetical protein
MCPLHNLSFYMLSVSCQRKVGCLFFPKLLDILSFNRRIGLPTGLFPFGFPSKSYINCFCHMRVTCPVHLILLDFINIIILGEEYKLRSSSLCSYLQSPISSSLFGPNSLVSSRFSCTLKSMLFP